MQGQQDQPITFQQKVNILQHITLLPALTIMVFLRRKIGYRFLDMLKIQAMFVLLLAYGAFSTLSFGPEAGGAVVRLSNVKQSVNMGSPDSPVIFYTQPVDTLFLYSLYSDRDNCFT